MALETLDRMEQVGLKNLSKEEIDRRIEHVMTRVTTTAGLPEAGPEDGPLQPRWITAAELVRRMRPFLVYN
jgi:hypothetical protein